MPAAALRCGGVDVRPAAPTDAEAIRSIYNREVTGGTFVFDILPRSLEDQLAWLDEHAGAHPAIVDFFAASIAW